MKKVILKEDGDVVLLNNLTDREIVVYLAKQTNTPKVLAKLSGGRHDPDPEKWGFISIAYPTGDVVFAAISFYESAKKALCGGRELLAFENYKEFRQWLMQQPIHKDTFTF